MTIVTTRKVRIHIRNVVNHNKPMSESSSSAICQPLQPYHTTVGIADCRVVFIIGDAVQNFLAVDKGLFVTIGPVSASSKLALLIPNLGNGK